ncbi:MAG TPA: cytochrome b [Xanthobacteraceae bacterium]|nr:cytochrome b [Xanthobacteraceae bacterium]
MQLRNSPERYGAIPKILHWAVVAFVLVSWTLGTFDDALPRGSARDSGLYVHMYAGLAVIILVTLRLLWRIGDPPPLPERTVLGAWLGHAALWAHYAMYALLIAAPVAGILLRFAGGEALPVFGLFDIASPWSADRAFKHTLEEVHEFLANALVILAGLHAAAAVFHHWVLRDGTLRRMLPGPTR